MKEIDRRFEPAYWIENKNSLEKTLKNGDKIYVCSDPGNGKIAEFYKKLAFEIMNDPKLDGGRVEGRFLEFIGDNVPLHPIDIKYIKNMYTGKVMQFDREYVFTFEE